MAAGDRTARHRVVFEAVPAHLEPVRRRLRGPAAKFVAGHTRLANQQARPEAALVEALHVRRVERSALHARGKPVVVRDHHRLARRARSRPEGDRVPRDPPPRRVGAVAAGDDGQLDLAMTDMP